MNCRDNYYPVKASTKQMDENDIIITYDECPFAIEVKAGKFTPRPAILDYESHIKSFSDMIPEYEKYFGEETKAAAAAVGKWFRQ